jgi:hypothetical protein
MVVWKGTTMATTKATSGTLWGVNWERHNYGIYCYAMGGNFYLLDRRYVGNGSDNLSVRECVRDFIKNVLCK